MAGVAGLSGRELWGTGSAGVGVAGLGGGIGKRGVGGDPRAGLERRG